VSTIVGFLAYSAADRFTLPSSLSAEAAVSIILGILLSLSMVSAVAAGWLSDRLGGRRKIIVIPASLMMAAASVLFATVTPYQIIIAVAALYGVAYGAFLSVDFAMVCFL
jgi:MFS family permease